MTAVMTTAVYRDATDAIANPVCAPWTHTAATLNGTAYALLCANPTAVDVVAHVPKTAAQQPVTSDATDVTAKHVCVQWIPTVAASPGTEHACLSAKTTAADADVAVHRARGTAIPVRGQITTPVMRVEHVIVHGTVHPAIAVTVPLVCG